MASVISSISNAFTKMRWKEPFITEGLNKKLNGIIPAGVVRGGKLSTAGAAMTVTIQSDSVSGDSVYSYVDSNGHQITYTRTGNETLDLTSYASTTIYIVLHISYTSSVDTVATWQAYSLVEVDADPNVVVLGYVNVPASGVIPAANIGDERRRTAWQGISQFVREPMQIIKNGDFELAHISTPSTDDTSWPWWDYPESTETGVSFLITSGGAQVGDKHLRLTLTGAGTQVGILPHEGFYQIRGGGTVRAKFWIKGTSLTPGPIGGHMGLRILIHDEDPSSSGLLQTEYVEDLSLSGTFAYTEVEHTFKLPTPGAAPAWMRVEVYFDDNGNNSTGTIYFDDIRVWIEQPQINDGQVEGFGPLHEGALLARSLDITKGFGEATSLADYIENLLSLRWAFGDTYDLKRRPDGSQDFLLRLINGGLDIGNLIEGLGGNQSQTHIEGAKPRIKTDLPDDSSVKFLLLWEVNQLVGTRANFRIYATENTTVVGASSLVITVNALWNGSSQTWSADKTVGTSYRIDITESGVYFCHREDISATWTDAEWNDSVDGFRTAYMIRSATLAPFMRLFLRGQINFENNDTTAGAVTPSATVDFPPHTTSTYNCLFELESSGSLLKMRVYTTTSNNISISDEETLIITFNAEWDGTQWDYDTTVGKIAHLWSLSGGESNFQGLKFYRYAGLGPWSDSGWTGASGSRVFSLNATNDDCHLDLNDGEIEFLNASFLTNPSPQGYKKNHLVAKLTLKGWGSFYTSSTNPTIRDGQNIASSGHIYPASNIVEITLDTAVDTAVNSCLLVSLQDNGSYPAGNYPHAVEITTNGANKIRIATYSNTGAAWNVDGSLVSMSYVIFSEMT